MLRRCALILALAAAAPPALLPAQEAEETPAPREPNEVIAEKLDSLTTTLELVGEPLAEALDLLEVRTDLPVLVDPRVDAWSESLLMNLQKGSPKEVLTAVLRSTGEDLAFTVWCGAVFVHPKDRPPPAPPALGEDAGELGETLRAKEVTLNLQESPLEDVAYFLGHVTGVEIALTDAVREAGLDLDPPMDFRCREMRLVDALSHVTLPYGLTWRLEEGGVTIDVAEGKAPGAAEAPQGE